MSREHKIGSECRLGHILTAENTEWYELKRGRALRCLECSRLCRSGKHVMEGENVRSYAGKTWKRCAACENDRSKARVHVKRDRSHIKSRPKSPEQLKQYQAAEISLGWRNAKIVEKVDARGNMAGPIRYEYLSPKGASLEALNKLNEAMEEIRTPCFDDPKEYMDWDEDSPPSNRRAQDLCFGCPVAKLCEDYGRKSRDRGVWGGVVILDNGKIQR